MYLDIFLVAKYRHGKSSVLGFGKSAWEHLKNIVPPSNHIESSKITQIVNKT
jgi:hypothetical protein